MTVIAADRLNLVDAEDATDSDRTDGEVSDDAHDGQSQTVFLAGDYIYRNHFADPPIDEALADRIAAAEVSLVNLEAPIPGDSTPLTKSGPTKHADPGAADVLTETGFDVACLANNHSMDYGRGGLETTLAACDDAGLRTVGAGENQQAALEPLELTIGHQSDAEPRSLAVVNVCEKEFGVAEVDTPGTAWASHQSTERRIAEAATEVDTVLVVSHGGIEFTPLPPQHRQTQLRGFVDAGADAVIGHHPHVPQGWEVYDESLICYSLGNFLFDQPKRPKTQWGLCVELTLRDGTPTDVTFVPTELVDGAVREMDRDGECEGEDRGEHDPDECLGYLHRASAIIADRRELRAHWQELAVRLFEQRYRNWLRRGTASGALELLRNPTAALGDGTWDPSERQTELLTLLNVIRNESHRDVVETALAVQTGDVTDRRTPEIEREVRELLAWTEDQEVYDRPSTAERVVHAVGGRLK